MCPSGASAAQRCKLPTTVPIIKGSTAVYGHDSIKFQLDLPFHGLTPLIPVTSRFPPGSQRSSLLVARVSAAAPPCVLFCFSVHGSPDVSAVDLLTLLTCNYALSASPWILLHAVNVPKTLYFHLAISSHV